MSRRGDLNRVADVVAPAEFFLNQSFVTRIDFVRCHADRAMLCRIVLIDELLQHVDVSPSVAVREVAIHFRFENTFEMLDHTHFDVFVFGRVKVNIVTLQHLLKGRVQKLRAFVALL